MTSVNSQGNLVFLCEPCKFETDKKSKWGRHINTRKHLLCTGPTGPESTGLGSDEYICLCGKEYAYKRSFSRHEKTCVNVIDASAYMKTTDTDVPGSGQIDNALVMEIIRENKELRTILMKQSDQISEIIPKIGNTTNNTMNKFNINVFLNENCKDALNIGDFVRSIQLQLADLEDTAKLGYIDGMTNIIARGLTDLGVTKRPFHCSDTSREVLYVKDNDEWGRDSTTNDKIKRAVELINRTNVKQMPAWAEKNPECADGEDPKNALYMTMLVETMDDDDKQDKKNARVVKNIAKTVVLTKSIMEDEVG